VVEWLRRNERDLVVDPIILGEGGSGFACCPRAGAGPDWNDGSRRSASVALFALGGGD